MSARVVLILLASIVLNFMLVPVLGMWGAGFVLLTSYAIGVLTRAIIVSGGFRPHASTLESVPAPL
jgi:hypothetical protein